MGKKADAVALDLQRFKELCVSEIREIADGERGVSWGSAERDATLRTLGLYELYHGGPETLSPVAPRVGDHLEQGPWLGHGNVMCRTRSGAGFACTRPEHATGPHVAYGTSVIEVWETGDTNDALN